MVTVGCDGAAGIEAEGSGVPGEDAEVGVEAVQAVDGVEGVGGVAALGCVEGGAAFAFASASTSFGVDDRGPVEHEGDEHSLYFEEPEGNVVEVWDFFEDGAGADADVSAIA